MNKKCKQLTRRIILKGVLILLVICAIVIAFVYEQKYNKSQYPSKQTVQTETNQTDKAKLTSTPAPEYIYKKKIIKKKKLIAKHTITNPNSYGNRNVNLKVAAKIINGRNKKGYVLKPGKNFSWIKVVGNTTAEKGFKVAGILLATGKHSEDLGGGVCQVASTLRTAADKAGLKTRAQPHSGTVSYLGPNDLEATVAYYSKKDLKIKNTLDNPVVMKVIVKGNRVTVKIFKVIKKIKIIRVRDTKDLGI